MQGSGFIISEHERHSNDTNTWKFAPIRMKLSFFGEFVSDDCKNEENLFFEVQKTRKKMILDFSHQ